MTRDKGQESEPLLEHIEDAGSPRCEVKRIGLIAVHGIGDQGRFHFLDGLVRDLQRAFQVAAGEDARVSASLITSGASLMGAAAPTLSEGPGPSAEIVVHEKGGRETRISIHEVWWGDIVDPPTFLQPLKFFAWGLAMWAVPLKHRRGFEQPAPGKVGEFLAEPEPREGRGPAILFAIRARLFLVGYLVVVLGLVLRLGLAALRVLTRQNFPDPVMTAISYMSDIKLYTQPTSPETVPLDHLGQHARFAIRARMVRTVVDVTLQRYEHWWVVAHSLGSVVAFSGLMTPDGLIARYLDETRWRRLQEFGDRRLLSHNKRMVPQDTKVACPAWLQPDACVDRKGLFKHFSGLITYGSPLDKFAMLWPAVIPISRDQTALEGRPWLNFYDETDPVAGHLDAFAKVGSQNAAFTPRNIGYAAYPVPLVSHLRYLSMGRQDCPEAADSLSTRLAGWWLDNAQAPQGGKVAAFIPGTSTRWLTPEEAARPRKQWPKPWRARRAWTWATWVVLAIVSPFATALIVALVGQLLPEWLLKWTARIWVPDGLWELVWGLSLVFAVLAVAVVLAAGGLGRLMVFPFHKADPDAQAPPSPSDGSTPPKPATKDTGPYA